MLISGAKKRGSAKRILVVSGGLSAEREVSLISGKECSNALRESNHTVREFDFTTLREFLKIVDPSHTLVVPMLPLPHKMGGRLCV